MNMIEALELGNNVEDRQREVINTYPDRLCSYLKKAIIANYQVQSYKNTIFGE